jgi:hypothetical protein
LRFVFDTPVQFQNLTNLNVDYNAVLGGIAAGSPRIALVVDTDNDNAADGQILINWGPPGSFADPTLGPGNTGNLLALTDLGRYDLSGLPTPGSFYTDRAAALMAAGSFNVLRASIILDSFGGNDRAFIINSISAADNSVASSVPEPASLAVWSLIGIAGGVYGWRRKKANASDHS